MRKSTMMSLVSYFAMQNNLPSDVADAVNELKAELNRNAVKAQANRDMYAVALDAVLAGLELCGRPVTAGELFDEIEGELPDGFTKGKLQYALSRMWGDKVLCISGKPNTYSLAK